MHGGRLTANDQQTQKDTNYALRALSQNCSVLNELDSLRPEIGVPATATTGLMNKEEIFVPVQVKPETGFKEEGNMYSDGMDGEFFQDLGLWCSTPAAGEPSLSTFDWTGKKEDSMIESHTFTPRTWETVPSPVEQRSFVSEPTPQNSGKTTFETTDILNIGNKQTEDYFDIGNLPIDFQETANDNNFNLIDSHWPETLDFKLSQDNMPNPFIIEDDSLGENPKLITWADTASNNDDIINEFIIKSNGSNKICSVQPLPQTNETKNKKSLKLDINPDPLAAEMDILNTPEVLKCVEQLENEKFNLYPSNDHTYTQPRPIESSYPPSYQSPSGASEAAFESAPPTPKPETQIDSDDEKPFTYIPKKRRRDSEDSDETYNPALDNLKVRKNKKKKGSILLEEAIQALDIPKVRRGRPPKRRDSNISNVSTDTNSMISNSECKYRMLRDKNNEASKRSRMNRKLKELQMDQLAEKLEEKNRKLRVQAEVLEDMTKRLKDALMSAILQK